MVPFEGSAYTHHRLLSTSPPPGQIAELRVIDVFPSMCSWDADKNMAPVNRKGQRYGGASKGVCIIGEEHKPDTADVHHFDAGATQLRSCKQSITRTGKNGIGINLKVHSNKDVPDPGE